MLHTKPAGGGSVIEEHKILALGKDGEAMRKAFVERALPQGGEVVNGIAQPFGAQSARRNVEDGDLAAGGAGESHGVTTGKEDAVVGKQNDLGSHAGIVC